MIRNSLLTLIALVLGLTGALAQITITTSSSNDSFVQASASLFGGPTNQQTDNTSPYFASAMISNQSQTQSANSSVSMNRQQTATTFGSSGTLTAAAVTPNGGVQSQSLAFDNWQFTLSQTATFVFNGSVAQSNSNSSSYGFFLEGNGIMRRFDNGDGQALVLSISLPAGSYTFRTSFNENAGSTMGTGNNTTNWSYTAGIPEPASTFLCCCGIALTACRRRSSF